MDPNWMMKINNSPRPRGAHLGTSACGHGAAFVVAIRAGGSFSPRSVQVQKTKGKEEGSRSKWAGRWAFFFSFGFLLFW
jgi:hypothetical protein